MGCARSRALPAAMPSCSNMMDGAVNGSAFNSFPSGAPLGSACFYGSDSFAILSFAPVLWIPSPEPPNPPLLTVAAKSSAPGGCPRSRAPELPSLCVTPVH